MKLPKIGTHEFIEKIADENAESYSGNRCSVDPGDTYAEEDRQEVADHYSSGFYDGYKIAGKNLKFIPEAAKEKWDNVETHPIGDDGKGNCEPCEEGEESFWSVYVHNVNGGVQCIADLPTKELANNLHDMIENLINSHTNFAK